MKQERFDNMTVKEIYWYPRKRFFFVLPIIIPLLGCIYVDVLKNGFDISLSTWIVAIIYFILMYFLITSNKKVDNMIDDMLFQHINLKKYRDYINYHYSKQNKLVPGIEIKRAIVAFYYGDFAATKTTINNIIAKQSRIILPKTTILVAKYYFILSLIHSKEDNVLIELKIQELDETRYGKYDGLKNRLLENCRQIHQIVTKKSLVEGFENVFGSKELHKIMFHYYSALNYLNQDQPEEAKACFKEIVNENPDLFYVKEAKKYLREMA